MENSRRGRSEGSGTTEERLNDEINKNAPELLTLSRERYRFPDQSNYKNWAKVFQFLAPHYIPSHQEVLDVVASLVVASE
jgi:hypothetical protein